MLCEWVGHLQKAFPGVGKLKSLRLFESYKLIKKKANITPDSSYKELKQVKKGFIN